MNSTEMEAAIRVFEGMRRDAMASGNTSALDALLADDLFYGHSTGAVDDKQSYLSKIASGASIYIDLGLEVSSVRQLGDTAAVAIGRMTGAVKNADGLLQVDNRFLTVWRFENGAWWLVTHQTTSLKVP